MTRTEILNALNGFGEDVYVWERQDGTIEVTINDFDGFDDDWNEIDRELENDEAITEFIHTLAETCNHMVNELYQTYYFDGFAVNVGWASFDI